MKVEFNWKRFGNEKPEGLVEIIFNYKNDLYFGNYSGSNLNDMQYFLGGKLRLKSLSKKNNQSLCIPLVEANEILWDVYDSNWV